MRLGLVGSAVRGSIALGLLLVLAYAAPAHAAGPCGSPVASVIACENSLPGDSPDDWQVSGSGDSTIQGFATSMSVNVGQTISFKVKTPATSYHIDILRLGYYQGNGARKIVSALRPSAALPQSQPACLVDSSTGLIDCGNWGVSASWTVPSTAVSGLYIAHLVRDDTGGSSQIPFVVRNDASTSDILLQTSDTTWAAYDDYGGNSLYTCTVSCPPGNPGAYKGAFKVSYNRPFNFNADSGRANPYYAEYPMIRFLEANGYDVSYISGADVDRSRALLLNHKLFISSGHDEYWSKAQRANVQAARDAGVNLAFFSGNEMFWKTRWESSIDGSATAYRTLVTYKETHFDAPTDPQDPSTWTGTWEDPRFSPPADGGLPPNALTGQNFLVNAGTSDIVVPAQDAKLRLWRNTAAASLTSGQSLDLGHGAGTLGYEWDEDADNGFRPPGVVDLSSTTVSNVQPFTDYGTNTGTGTATHNLTLYRAPSGALVFGSGTVQWSWGLDSENIGGKAPDQNMQQATVNLLADMGSQPFAPLPGLVTASASTDATPPSSTVTSPAPAANFQDSATVTIAGTASDAGGGVVGGVEVSTDGGSTWHRATLTTPAAANVTWSYAWVVHGSPTSTIESRAVDDSGNLETPSAGVTVNVACPCSLWGTAVTPSNADSGDKSSIEVGVKFRSDVFGTVTGIRFYKASTNTGTHIGNLWSSSGGLLASATFTGETASGWQAVTFSKPVIVNPNTTYVASYFAPAGHYAETGGYFFPPPSPPPHGGGSVDSPPLHALRSTGATTNGVYTYGASSSFPTSTFNAENYWVDPVFSPQTAPGQVTSVSASPGYASATLSWSAPSTGGPATTYTITPYVGSTPQSPTTFTGSPAPTTGTVSGLTNGTTYTFTVTASNPAGSGPASTASNPATPQSTLSVVFNGGFESGLAGWATSGVAPPVASIARAHAGTGSALLGTLSGAEPNGDSSLSQTVQVPAGTSTLQFWYWPATADSVCSGSACKFDWQEAQIRSTSGTTLASVFKSNSNAQAWTQVSFDTSAYAGQTVILWFNVHQDGSSPPDDTSMYLDDVALNVAGAPTAPGAPAGVSATAGNASATVSWTAPSTGGSPITGYTVTPYVGSAAQTPTTITGSPPATNATVTGLTNGTAYTFKVSATNAVGTGPDSSASNAVTPTAPTAPGAPAGVSATAGNASATVSWTAPSTGGSPITGYTVTPYVGSAAQTPTTITGSPPATNATVAGLTNGTAYTFTVKATNAIGTGSESGQSNAVTPSSSSVVPAFVQKVTSNLANVASATVTPTANITSGNRLIVLVGVWSGSTATAKSVTDSAGNQYVELLHFTASDSNEMSVWSAPVTAGGGTRPTITVTPSARADVGVAALEYSGLSTVSDATVVDQMSHATGTTSGAGTVASGATAATTAGNELALGLYADSGFGRTLAAGSGWSPRANVSPTGDMELLAEDQPVAAGATPNATVGSGANTVWLMAAIVLKGGSTAPPTAPGAPAGVSATAGNASATVSWTAPSTGGSPITGYTVTPYVGSAAQTPTTITGSPPATNATVTGLTNGTAYTFKVSATNAVGTGPDSSASNAVTPTAPTAPGAPAGVSATAGNASATVSWTAPSTGGSPITGYTVTPYVGSAAQTPTTITGSPPATNATVAGLTNGTAYTFTVKATNAIGTGSESGQSNAVTPSSSSVVPAFVQKVTSNLANVASATVTPTANITSGNRLIVLVGVWASGGPTAASVTDTAGNHYTEIQHFKASDKSELSVWTAPITAGGGTRPTVTATPSSRADVGIAVVEYSGLSAVNDATVADRTAQGTGTTTAAGTVSSGPTASTTTSNELALGFYVDSGFSDTLTAGTGFSSRASIFPSSDMELYIEDAIVGQGATPNASVGTGPSTTWMMSTIAFNHG
jgi:hypothetical protein